MKKKKGVCFEKKAVLLLRKFPTIVKNKSLIKTKNDAYN